ncbi:hypothetical protein TRFO_11825 [Tritrichomonas foetus]|uniref:Uncharacterized protein n=1 Tax=Tritrichomonas foetus TaxID=1144522 RepID=A0A1J4J5J2_9EUKA|nr:hypothetical protein TRFO_11825 [Tritrichomonas foetus]|eukprot:OHS93407.1 hypothetical protein TRFO_11825 [Tritrichomonas foetus]
MIYTQFEDRRNNAIGIFRNHLDTIGKDCNEVGFFFHGDVDMYPKIQNLRLLTDISLTSMLICNSAEDKFNAIKKIINQKSDFSAIYSSLKTKWNEIQVPSIYQNNENLSFLFKGLDEITSRFNVDLLQNTDNEVHHEDVDIMESKISISNIYCSIVQFFTYTSTFLDLYERIESDEQYFIETKIKPRNEVNKAAPKKIEQDSSKSSELNSLDEKAIDEEYMKLLEQINKIEDDIVCHDGNSSQLKKRLKEVIKKNNELEPKNQKFLEEREALEAELEQMKSEFNELKNIKTRSFAKMQKIESDINSAKKERGKLTKLQQRKPQNDNFSYTICAKYSWHGFYLLFLQIFEIIFMYLKLISRKAGKIELNIDYSVKDCVASFKANSSNCIQKGGFSILIGLILTVAYFLCGLLSVGFGHMGNGVTKAKAMLISKLETKND